MPNALETKGFYEFGSYRLDPRARVLLRDGSLVRLTPKVLDTLLVLVEHAGQPVSKEELLHSVWPDTFVEESNLTQNISVLRKVLSSADETPFIETIAKRGYRFVPAVQFVAPQTEAPPETRPRKHEASRWGRKKWLIAGTAALATLVVLLYTLAASRPTPIRSIAVLPFKNLSGDAAQDFLADGITELLTAELSKTLPIRVTSRTSAILYRNSGKPVAAIAKDLNVDAVVEGSVARSQDRLRLTVQLIQAAADRHMWAETYDRNLTDSLLLEQEIARVLAREIRVPASAPGGPRAQVNREAFEDYLRARYYAGQRNPSDVKKAIEWYEKAIGVDPAYAAPYAGLADCYNQLGTVMIGGRSPAESRKLAIASAKKAIEIDPDLAEAHAVLAYSNLYEWNWAAAEAGFERAIHLNPNYPAAHLWFGHYLAARGQFDRALQEVRLAADLDPLSEITQTQIAWTLAHARRFPEALREYQRVLAGHPNFQWALWAYGGALIEVRDYNGSIAILKRAAELGNRSPSALGTLGRAYGLAGRRTEALEILDELTRLARERFVPPHTFVHVYIGLGDRDKAFEWLEKSYQERSNSLIWIGVGAMFDPLRQDPRFDNLLRRVGLK